MIQGKLCLLFLTAAAWMALQQNSVLCQNVTRARTEAGKEVLLYPDGSWKYAEDKRSVSPQPPSSSKPPSAKAEYKIRDGRFSLWVDPGKWTRSSAPITPPVELRLTHKSGDGYVLVVAERIAIPIASLRETVVDSIKKVAEAVQVVLEEKRTVNGREVLCLQIEAVVKEVPFTYYGYYYSGESGTIQVITYTGRSLFKEFQTDFTGVLNGLEVQ